MTEKSYFWSNRNIGDGVYSAYDDDEFSDIWRIMFQRDRTVQSVIEDYANELQVTNPAGNTIQVATGAALVDGKFYITDAAVNNSISTPAVSTRYDRVVLRKSWASQTVRVAILTGVEGGGVPAITQTDGVTWEVALATIEITTGAAITITDERQFSRTALSPLVEYESGITLLETVEVSGVVQASIAFSSISQNYSHLLFLGMVRSDHAAITDLLEVTTNLGVASHNYIQGNNTTISGAAALSDDLGNVPAASAAAGYAGGLRAHIMGYSNTSLYKNILADVLCIPSTTLSQFYLRQTGLNVNSLSAITSVTFGLVNGNFDLGSTISMYGLL